MKTIYPDGWKPDSVQSFNNWCLHIHSEVRNLNKEQKKNLKNEYNKSLQQRGS